MKEINLERIVTVKELIELLKEYPQDLPIGIDYSPYEGVRLEIRTWEHGNYPYDKPSFDYVSIE